MLSKDDFKVGEIVGRKMLDDGEAGPKRKWIITELLRNNVRVKEFEPAPWRVKGRSEKVLYTIVQPLKLIKL